VPKNKKPRKKYRPLSYHLNPLAMLSDHSQQTMNESELTNLMIAVHSSLKAIEEGKGIEEDIIHLAVASNIVLIFAEHGLGEEYIPEVKLAQRHIVNLQELWRQEKRAVLSGPGMIAIRRMLELHDEQMKHEGANEANMRKAMRLIYARMQAGNVLIPDRRPA
jgi:thiamine kinase-like enzyme